MWHNIGFMSEQIQVASVLSIIKFKTGVAKFFIQLIMHKNQTTLQKVAKYISLMATETGTELEVIKSNQP